MLLSQQNTENEQKTEKTNHRLARISKQVTFDLVGRYFLSKKQRKSFNAPLYVLKKNINSNDNSHMRKRLTAVLLGGDIVSSRTGTGEDGEQYTLSEHGEQ